MLIGQGIVFTKHPNNEDNAVEGKINVKL